MKKQTGITIIALIITIILMLILATISVNVAINGGLFEKASDAVDSAEIANEKDTVVKANILAKSKNKIVSVDDVQKALDSITGENAATVMDNGETLVVKFNKNDRYYEIENSGKVQGPMELVKDDYPGDITKGGTCDGSVNKPFKITCIEDLVAFSIMTNGGNNTLGLAKNNFKSQYIELTRTLDFKSIFSYKDYTTTIYGDLNTDGKVEDIKTELTRTDEGCIGFTGINFFQGIFDGSGYELKNIYSKALFKSISGATVKDIYVSGKSVVGDYAQVGIIMDAINSYIYNCCSNVEVSGTMVAGVVMSCKDTNVINCYNLGKISAKWQSGVGGIVGQTIGDCEIYNSYNLADVELKNGNANPYTGGILGMVGNSYTESICSVKNCYNIGNITTSRNGYAGSICGGVPFDISKCILEKCYYLEGLAVNEDAIELTKLQMQNKQNIGENNIIDMLNEYVDNYNKENKEEENFVELKHWEIGENGYPGFVDKK